MDRFDFLCFSSTDWDEIWGSRQQIMSRLAKRGHRVFFIERPSGFEHLFRYSNIRKHKSQRWKEGIKNISDNLWIIPLPPLLPGKFYSTHINSLNQWMTVNSVTKQCADLKIQSPILWIYNPEQGQLIGRFNERVCIYHCIDEFTANTSGRKKQTIIKLEKQLLTRSHIVFANSLPTYQNKLALNPNTYRLSSGVDFEAFDSPQNFEEVSRQFVDIPHPRIGFVGYLNERIDFPLIEFLAIQRPAWSFFFIGDTYPLPVDHPAIIQLKTHPNCHIISKNSYAKIPAFIHEFDICIMPFVQDERAHFRSPLKLYEYFASGKPVVSTPLPESQEFSNLLYMANSPEEFVIEIEKALLETDVLLKTQRKQIARQNSWDAKVDFIEKIIHNTLE